jgi:hypothetical protein
MRFVLPRRAALLLVFAALSTFALLGTFAYVVRQATEAGMSRHLPEPKSTPANGRQNRTVTPSRQ